MAEVGIIATVLQIADIGLRLPLRLHTLGERVASTDKSIISISKDVSLALNVLKELGQTLGSDRDSPIYSPQAIQTAETIVKYCLRILEEVDQVLVKNLANTMSAEKEEKDRSFRAVQVLERLKWPFVKRKIELLTSNLERQKSAWVLMLNRYNFA